MSQTPFKAPTNSTINVKNVQGDLVIGLQKRVEYFSFFSISDAASFKKALKKLVPLITTTEQVLADQKKINDARSSVGGKRVWLPLAQANIALSATGLKKLGVDVYADFVGHDAFLGGQKADALANLNDEQTTDGKLKTWKDAFLKNEIHGVFLVTASKDYDAHCKIQDIEHILGHSVKIVYEVNGTVRPGAEEGHEHFGYLDGISHPVIKGFNDAGALPNTDIIDANVVVLTEDKWTKDGSFLAFRELQQFVPEFDEFVRKTAVGFQKDVPGITPDIVGSRIVGRWKSGAPVVITPGKDDPVLGADPKRRNNFDFANDLLGEACPYVSHIRKTNPRHTPNNIPVLPHLLMRAGIPYGPELTLIETKTKKTKIERGLLFACYQSKLEAGFQFVQNLWANNTRFPFGNAAGITEVGEDLIIGQAKDGDRSAQGIKPNASTDPANLVKTKAEFVIPRGGEYFFVPSLDALAHKFSA